MLPWPPSWSLQLVKPRIRPLANAVNAALSDPRAATLRQRQSGMSLVEVSVAVALVALAGAGVYSVFKPTNTMGQVQSQVTALHQLKANVSQAYSNQANFSGISYGLGTQDGWLPRPLQVPTAWGQLAVAPATNVSANDSWSAAFPNVPAEACQRVVLDEMSNWDKVTVNNAPITSVQQAITACQNGGNVAFMSYGGLRGNSNVGSLVPPGGTPGLPPVTGTPIPSAPSPAGIPPPGADGGAAPTGPAVGLPAAPAPPSGAAPPAPSSPNLPGAPTYPNLCTVPAPQTQTVACPAGQVGSISQTSAASCPAPYGNPTWGPWTTTTNSCAPACVLPTPSTQTQSIACPSGQISSVAPYSANGITQTQTASCPAASGSYIWSAWTTTGNTCALKCVAPAPSSQVNTATGSCPGGQVLSNGASTFAQSQSRSVTYSCPSPTGSYSTAYGAYSALSPTAAQAGCAPICTPPARTYTSTGCPAGQLGTISYYADGGCTAPNGTAYYGGWVAYSNTCAPVCVAPPPFSNYAGQQNGATINGSCPSGQSGVYQYAPVQNLYDNYYYYCGAPTGPATLAYSGRTATNTGSYTVITNTCKTTCVSVDAFVVVRRQGVVSVMVAGDVREGDELKLINPGNGDTRWGLVSVSYTETVEMVRILTEDEVNLSCSKTAPIGLADGGHVVAADLLDHEVATEVEGVYGSSRVTAVRDLGLGQVQMITCENDFFLAGDVQGRYLAHHNKKNGSGCVSPEAFVIARRNGEVQNLIAGDVRLGDELRVMDPITGQTKWGRVVIAKQTVNDMVRIATASGVELDCSIEAPMGLSSGEYRFAKDLMGQVLSTEQDGLFVASEVVDVKPLSTTVVCHLHCDGGAFLVGNTIGSYLVHE